MQGRGFQQFIGDPDPNDSPPLFDAVVTNTAELAAAITDPAVNTIWVRDGNYTTVAYDLTAVANNVWLIRGESQLGVRIDMGGTAWRNSARTCIYISDITFLNGQLREIGTWGAAAGNIGGVTNVCIDESAATYAGIAFNECENMFNCRVIGPQHTSYDDCVGMFDCGVINSRHGVAVPAFNACAHGHGIRMYNSTTAMMVGCYDMVDVRLKECDPAIGSTVMMFTGCRNLSEVAFLDHDSESTGALFDQCDNISNVNVMAGGVNTTHHEGPLFDRCFNISGVYLAAGEYYNGSVGNPGLFQDCQEITGVYAEGSVSLYQYLMSACSKVSNVRLEDIAAAIAGTRLFNACDNLVNIEVNEFDPQAFGINYVFHTCTYLMNCQINTGGTTAPWEFFFTCAELTNCTTDDAPSNAGNLITFNTCTDLVNCYATSSNVLNAGFQSCDQLYQCEVVGGAGPVVASFNLCTNILDCSGNALEFLNCSFVVYEELPFAAGPVTAYSGMSINNTGAAGAVTVNLPSAAAGIMVRVTAVVDEDIVLQLAAGDQAHVNGQSTTAAGTLTLLEQFTMVDLVAVDATNWIAMAAVGSFETT